MKPASSPVLRADHASAVLRKRILDGDLNPGTLIAESSAALDLGVSRVPVREALFSLERDGLVEFSKSGRAYVKKLSLHDFEELYALRLALEPLGAAMAAPRLVTNLSALERNVQATLRAKTIQDVTRIDLDFHQLILEASDNARLLKLWCSLRGELELWLGQLHRRHQANRLDTRKGTAAAHEEIIHGFKTATSDACKRLLQKHIQTWREWLPLAA